MLSILTVTLPIYILIALGYSVVRWGLFPRDGMKTLGLFVVRFALPALLFKALSQSPVEDVLNGRFLLAYALGSLLSFGWGWFSERQHEDSFRAIRGIGMSVSNTGFVGAPIVLQWLGPSVSVAFALAMIVENLLILPLTLVLAERNQRGGASPSELLGQTLKPLIKNPLILAIFSGFLCAVFEVDLPAPITRVVDLLAGASGAVALMVIGGTLVGLKTEGMLPDVGKLVAGKLIVHPLCVGLFMFLLMANQPILCAAAIALAAMPMMGIYPIIGQKYRHDGFCAAALLMTTVASFFTLLGLMSLLKHFVLN